MCVVINFDAIPAREPNIYIVLSPNHSKVIRVLGRELEAICDMEWREMEDHPEASTIQALIAHRAAYDEERRRQRSDQLHSKKHAVTTTIRSFLSVSTQTIKTTKTVLGPFATPVFIIAFLIA